MAGAGSTSPVYNIREKMEEIDFNIKHLLKEINMNKDGIAALEDGAVGPDQAARQLEVSRLMVTLKELQSSVAENNGLIGANKTSIDHLTALLQDTVNNMSQYVRSSRQRVSTEGGRRRRKITKRKKKRKKRRKSGRRKLRTKRRTRRRRMKGGG